MLFTSLTFLCFLFALLWAYYLLPRRCQPWLLLGASLYIAYSLSHKLIVFMLFSAAVAWATALGIDAVNGREKAATAAAKQAGADRAGRAAVKKAYRARKRWIMLAAWACNLGLLLFFKFYAIIAGQLAAYGAPLPAWALALPLGISFYTLQLLSYTMDVYRGKQKAERSLFRVLLFTCYFPQIMQGPIGRWGQLAPQLQAPHSFSWDRFTMGCSRILWGFFKKLVIADRLAIVTRELYNGYETYTGFYVVVAAVLYTFQLYGDFSGGIDIAMGASTMLGIDLAENFERPLFSKSIAEFWRRWHITLGTWLRDYVFYPLTLSKTMARVTRFFTRRSWRFAAKWATTYVSLLLLWLCSGLWHGEGWQYICSGLWHGGLIMIGNTIEKPSEAFWARRGVAQTDRRLQLFRMARTFCFVAVGEIMFGSASFTMMCGLFRGMFTVWNPWILWDGSLLQLGLNPAEYTVAFAGLAVLLAASLLSRDRPVREKIAARPLPQRWALYLAGLVAVVVFGVYGANYPVTPFIYYQF